MEARLGLSVTPFCDRRTVVVSTMQLRFVDMFLRPLLPHLTWAVGTALSQQLAAGLAHTSAHWTEHRCAVRRWVSMWLHLLNWHERNLHKQRAEGVNLLVAVEFQPSACTSRVRSRPKLS